MVSPLEELVAHNFHLDRYASDSENFVLVMRQAAILRPTWAMSLSRSSETR